MPSLLLRGACAATCRTRIVETLQQKDITISQPNQFSAMLLSGQCRRQHVGSSKQLGVAISQTTAKNHATASDRVDLSGHWLLTKRHQLRYNAWVSIRWSCSILSQCLLLTAAVICFQLDSFSLPQSHTQPHFYTFWTFVSYSAVRDLEVEKNRHIPGLAGKQPAMEST